VDSALILGYHRIAKAPWDPYSMCVRPEHFAEHLEVLSKYANPIGLQELAQSLVNGRVPSRAVAITFDDGYADNLHNAKPLLENYQVPATVFVVTGNFGREFWWDELNNILMTPKAWPKILRLTIEGNSHQWIFKNGADSVEREQDLLFHNKHLRFISEGERQSQFAELRTWIGADSRGHNLQRALTSDEVIELSNGELLEIGAHTMAHPFLDGLATADQKFEIQQSKSILENLLGRTVSSFSYPNGSSSERIMAIVRDSGFTCACTTRNDVVWRGSDPFQLPRFWVPDCDGKTFSRWLKKWLHG
jgi:peptidoglycan/xylan/chitin deacetylase (PgdA/CDA1 family)